MRLRNPNPEHKGVHGRRKKDGKDYSTIPEELLVPEELKAKKASSKKDAPRRSGIEGLGSTACGLKFRPLGFGQGFGSRLRV